MKRVNVRDENEWGERRVRKHVLPQPLQPSQLVSRWEWVRGVVKGEGVERGNR